jgi:hypothetical protein
VPALVSQGYGAGPAFVVNMRSYAVAWLGSRADRNELARRLSPLTDVRAGQPPILTVHGDADSVSPYQDAVRFHNSLLLPVTLAPAPPPFHPRRPRRILPHPLIPIP